MSAPHRIEVRSVERLTHDARRLRGERAAGHPFSPGHATELRLDAGSWRSSPPRQVHLAPAARLLESTIESSPDHDGVAEQFAHVGAGDPVVMPGDSRSCAAAASHPDERTAPS